MMENMTVVADLHVHTNASDGLLSPKAVVKKAVAANLAVIAITDHDTVGGIDEALIAKQDTTLQVIAGIELSCEIHSTEVHILGFFIDHHYPALRQLLDTLHHSRFIRAEKMVKKLNALDYEIDLASVLSYAKEGAPGRPHVARALVETGYFFSVSEVFEKLLGFNMPGYVERYKLTPGEAISIIREAGGVAVWAHPALSHADTLLEQFVRQGLQGLEVYHPDHQAEQTSHYQHLAKKYHLFTTGGSDFHGSEVGRARELAYCGLTDQEFYDFLLASQKKL
jgi:predicted metal-dependent phosphoesterase TrpH